MFLAQNHPIPRARQSPQGGFGAVVAAAALPPQGCVVTDVVDVLSVTVGID